MKTKIQALQDAVAKLTNAVDGIQALTEDTILNSYAEKMFKLLSRYAWLHKYDEDSFSNRWYKKLADLDDEIFNLVREIQARRK